MNKLRLTIAAIFIATFANGQVQNLERIRGEDLNDIMFYDDLIGYIVGDNGVILKTSDGGTTWTDLSEKANHITLEKGRNSRINLTSIFIIDDNQAYIVGNSSILIKTSDGGLTWRKTPLDLGSSSLSDVYFPSSKVGYVTISSRFINYILKTEDNGESWQNIAVPSQLSPTSVFFLDDNVGFLGGSAGEFFKTTDGGKNWLRIRQTGSSPINDIYFFDENNGVIISELSGVLYFLEGEVIPAYLLVEIEKDGKDKFYLASTASDALIKFNSINFLDGNYGYLVGLGFAEYGAGDRKMGIYVTGDGGKSWFPLSKLSHEREFNAVSSNGIVIGEMGTIIKVDHNFMSQRIKEVEAIIKE